MKILHWCVWITADVWYQRWGSCSQGCNNDSVVVTGHQSQLRRNNKQTNTWTITLLSMVKMTRQEQSLFTLWFIIPHLYSERLVIQIHSSLWLFSSSILIILGWVLHLLRHSDTSLIFADFILNNFVQLVQSHAVLETPAIRILLCDSELTSLEDLGAATY